MEPGQILYMAIYILEIVYFTILGTYMFFRYVGERATEIERQRQRGINHAIGFYMYGWAFQCFIYLPSILSYGFATSNIGFELCFMICMIMNVFMLFMVMNALLQHNTGMWSMVLLSALPELGVMLWWMLDEDDETQTQVYAMISVCVISMALIYMYYHRECKKYIAALKSEYSDLSRRSLSWTWYSISSYTLQAFLYIFYQLNFSITLEYIYIAFSMLNATAMVYCARNMLPLGAHLCIDGDNCYDDSMDGICLDEGKAGVSPALQKKFEIIEEMLRDFCVEKQIYLKPELTRDVLCDEINVSRNTLSAYFHAKNTSYYQYVNSLRIEHACSLLRDNEEKVSAKEIALKSGFANYRTFLNVFKEYMGCNPTEYMKKMKSEE